MDFRPKVKYLKKNFDEMAILGALVKVSIDGDETFSHDERIVLTAFRRSTPSLEGASIGEIGDYLKGYDEEQIPGLVSNIKGILHEVEFVELENSDGDSIQASLFTDTNHSDTDVLMFDSSMEDSWEVQLRATSNAHYVNDWMEDHPEDEIVITEELAEKLGVKSSGFSNEQLTYRVENVTDKLLEVDENSSIWTFVPGVGAASISLLLISLWRRYRFGEINYGDFKRLSLRMTGFKVAKISFISYLLTIPGINVATGAALIAKLILSSDKAVDRIKVKPFSRN
ncbi:MAG: hypothetical protein C0617_11115 [Desulfuromonas sp.]|uniref:hypothetical protein n=1 Tax=Desulfuromonas sp. TaxID=892 RepID=UPI000CCAF72A|nr:hypothetical protein [Desulfuromonas sp.]PLX83676.1 MAG: hypothetical protein C0617_11115 [Desulfuromonas sp.]